LKLQLVRRDYSYVALQETSRPQARYEVRSPAQENGPVEAAAEAATDARSKKRESLIYCGFPFAVTGRA
jgi:hypothetical protein